MHRIINTWRMSHGNLMETRRYWRQRQHHFFISQICTEQLLCSRFYCRNWRFKRKAGQTTTRASCNQFSSKCGSWGNCAAKVLSSWDVLTFHSHNKSLKLGPLSGIGFSWLDSATPGGWGYCCTRPQDWTGLPNHQEALEAVPRALAPPQPRVSASLMLTLCPGREHPTGSDHKPISWVLRFRTNIWHPPCMAAGECPWKWKIKSESYMLIQKDHKKVWFIYKVPTSRIKHVYLRPEGGKG